MSIFEYDEQREIELIRRDEREIGKEIGAQPELAIKKLMDQCKLSREQAEEQMALYWK